MARKAKATRERTPKGKDAGKKFKKKVCIFCQEKVEWVDYKDVNLLRRYMSDRAKIRARRVSGNCAQHQRDVAVAIKTAREVALLPYTVRVTSSRGGGRPGRDRDGDGGRPPRGDREDRSELQLDVPDVPVVDDAVDDVAVEDVAVESDVQTLEIIGLDGGDDE
jgi:small subunit ribosomal protein S18